MLSVNIEVGASLEKRDHPTVVPAGPLFHPLPSGNLEVTIFAVKS